MKLTLAQLEQHTAGKLSAVYLISGDDPIQKTEALQHIRKNAKRAGFSERSRFSGEGLDEEQLYTALYSSSLSAEKTLLELDFRNKAPTKPIAAILENYLAKPSPDILVLMDIGKLEDTTTRSAWYKAIEKNHAVITIWPVSREQLPQWIIARARKYKINIQTDAAALLADYVEGNLTAAAQTIEKIYLLNHEKPIDVALIQSILADESRYTVFDFTESMLTDNAARTLHILETLRDDGTEAILVLWGITRELRLLAEMTTERQAGISFDDIFRKHRIYSRRQGSIRSFLSRFNEQKCHQCLTHAAEIDTLIKGAKPGNSWEALQMLALKLV